MKSNEIGLRSRVWPKRGFVENVEFASCAKRTRLKERRGWDSNPRWSYPHSGFRDRPVQPLQHLSGRSDKENIVREFGDSPSLDCLFCYSVLDNFRGEGRMKTAPKSAAKVLILENNDPISAEIEAVQSQIRQRAFELSQSRPSDAYALYDWMTAQSEIVSVPPMELLETDGRFELKFAVAGIDPYNVSVMVTPGQIL